MSYGFSRNQYYDHQANNTDLPELTKIVMCKKTKRRLLQDAKKILTGFGIDWHQYGKGEITEHSPTACEVKWTHLESNKTLILSNVLHNDNGAILKSGRGILI